MIRISVYSEAAGADAYSNLDMSRRSTIMTRDGVQSETDLLEEFKIGYMHNSPGAF